MTEKDVKNTWDILYGFPENLLSKQKEGYEDFVTIRRSSAKEIELNHLRNPDIKLAFLGIVQTKTQEINKR